MFNAKKKRNDQILAWSWNIATEPKLYRELAPNPYSPKSLTIISERFPKADEVDIIKAVILAEPEGRSGQKEENISEITKRLVVYCKQHEEYLRELPKEVIYDTLSRQAFETDNFDEIEQRYSQNQRLNSRLAIIDFIENKQKNKNHSLLEVTCIIASFALLFFVARNNYQFTGVKQQVLGAETQNKDQVVSPSHLLIPKLNMNANIEYVGVNSDGTMATPNNISDVGWFDLGPRPGDKGSAVIAGHFDGVYGQPAVFANLDKLQAGDKVYVQDDKGNRVTFVVRGSRLLDPGYADDVFSPSDSSHLNLITCDGVWDKAKKSFTKRLVVFTDRE